MRTGRFNAAQIRAARKGLGLTQREFAERLGVSLGAVRAWEQGRSTPGTITHQVAVEAAIREAKETR